MRSNMVSPGVAAVPGRRMSDEWFSRRRVVSSGAAVPSSHSPPSAARSSPVSTARSASPSGARSRLSPGASRS
ncbi:hypothetical protein STCU_11846 [Strigomonas culicis]|uniref:Uncharacterized protein n=1 Tax=Strigomonas culicis TaxID=28005 RepID=S9TCD8_9TRYP|nr:hypothetical protein STCU_11846 [Strigomonas culicis]|eukprot:EPY15667.1 hypothetical protein STCU_11846 [Strigomonas culicis]